MNSAFFMGVVAASGTAPTPPEPPPVDPGLAVLASSIAWGSVLSQTEIDESQVAAPDVFSAVTSTPGAADPWGGTDAYEIRDTAATSQHLFQCTPTLLITGGLYELRFYVKPATAKGQDLWVTRQGASHIQRVELINKYINVAGGSAPLRGRLRLLDSGWWEYRATFEAGAAPNTSQRFRVYLDKGASYLGTGDLQMTCTGVYVDRLAVSSQANLSDGAATITQSTAADRPLVSSDAWQWSSAALAADGHGGHFSVSEAPEALSGTGQPFSIALLYSPKTPWKERSAPPASRQLLRLEGPTASLTLYQTDTGLKMERTNDAAITTTATLPITTLYDTSQTIHVTSDGATAQLYVQGVALGAAQSIGSGLCTYTACKIGGDASASITEWAIWDTERSGADVLTSAATLATRHDHTVDPVPLWIVTGQSNGEGLRGVMTEASYADQFSPGMGKALFRSKIAGDVNESQWGWGALRQYDNAYSTTIQYADNDGKFGFERTFCETLGRVAFMRSVKGGSFIASWLTGGLYYADLVAELGDGLADLAAGGMPYTVAGMINVHGESDSGNESNANAFTGRVDTLASEIETDQGITLPVTKLVRVSKDYAGAAYLSLLRSNVDAWRSAPGKIAVDIDFVVLSDTAHWDTASQLTAGVEIAVPTTYTDEP